MEFKNDRTRLICGDIIKSLNKIDEGSIDMTIVETCEEKFKSFTTIAKELSRVTNQGGVIAWITSDRVIKGSKSGNTFKQALYFKELGLNIHDVVICDKGVCNHKDINRYPQCFSYVIILSKGSPKTFNQPKITTNIIKQSKLVEVLILSLTNKNESILELKMSNSNVGKTVVNNERYFIGISDNQNDYDISKQIILRELEMPKVKRLI